MTTRVLWWRVPGGTSRWVTAEMPPMWPKPWETGSRIMWILTLGQCHSSMLMSLMPAMCFRIQKKISRRCKICNWVRKIFELAVELVTSTCWLAMSALSNWVKCSSLCGPISHSLKIDHPNGESALKVLCWVDTTTQSQDWRFSLRVYVQYLLWEVHRLQFALINVPRFVIGLFFRDIGEYVQHLLEAPHLGFWATVAHDWIQLITLKLTNLLY